MLAWNELGTGNYGVGMGPWLEFREVKGTDPRGRGAHTKKTERGRKQRGEGSLF